MKTFIINDEKYVGDRYQAKFNKKLSFHSPQTFNEKLNVMKIDDAAMEVSRYVDKYAVREHIAQSIGEQYLVEIYGVYDYFNKDVFDSLPDQFIIKGVHGVSMNFICKDKSQVEYKTLYRKLDKWLNRNAYYISREKQYKNIQPRYIVEKLMQTEDGKCPSDYKFHCFNGKIEFVSVVSSRFDDNYTFTNYDPEGNVLPFCYNGTPSSDVSKIDLAPFEKVVEALAGDFKFVRVDLYYFEGEVKFGELTFTPFGGMGLFEPESFDLSYGQLFDIDSKRSFLKDL